MSKLVRAGQAAFIRKRRSVTRDRARVPTGDGSVVSDRFLRLEALRIVKQRDAGLLPPKMAESLLEMIRIETQQVLARNGAVANDWPIPDFKVPPAPKPVKRPPKPKRSYHRRKVMPDHKFRQLEEAGTFDVSPAEPWLEYEEVEPELS